METKQFKVIIVGGSIAGLTLAHSLSQAGGIDYTILEKRDQISPQEGASIGILPHGGRILAQLGLLDAIEDQVEPLHTAHIRHPDGFQHTNRSPKVVEERFGLPLAFLERRKALQVLHEALPDPSKALVNQTVIRVEESPHGIAVHTHDGSVYVGDLVVGADGVHSRVRAEMWRLADSQNPGSITQHEKKGMTVEYACVFGISTTLSTLQSGEQIASMHGRRCFLIFPGKYGRVFWFLIQKLDQKYQYGQAPRFSSHDAERTCEKFASDLIWKNVRFGDLWDRRQVFSMTALEENVFQTWHWGRMVCIGDSMHKVAPNTGQGANCAIEDAAALANLLSGQMRQFDNNGGHQVSDSQVDTLLRHFTQARLQRVQAIYKSARMVVRLHTQETLLLRLASRYYLPYSGDLAADTASRYIAGAVALDFLTLPKRSIKTAWEAQPRGIRGVPRAMVKLVAPIVFLLFLTVWNKAKWTV